MDWFNQWIGFQPGVELLVDCFNQKYSEQWIGSYWNILTGKPHISLENRWFPVSIFPRNPLIRT